MAIIKDWGHTSLIFLNETLEIHKLFIKNQGFSSEHCHLYKYNMFYIDSGHLNVSIWKNDQEIIYSLNTGNILTIEPNIKHKFFALEDSYVTEIYYTKINTNDIIRYT